MSEAKKARLSEKYQQSQGWTPGDKRRIFLMVAALVAVLAGFFQLSSNADANDEPETKQESGTSQVKLPEFDKTLLRQVRDQEASDRVLLEPEAFESLLKASLLLLPNHIKILGEPEIPFDEIEDRATELRGSPYRVRGALKDYRPLKRPGGAPEYWCWIQTESGDDVFFVAVQPMTEFFSQGENHVRADGHFLKIYTQTLDTADGPQRVTAPLLVGREVVTSYSEQSPVSTIDPTVMARVSDPEGFELTPLDHHGLWHLLNVSDTLEKSGSPPVLSEQEPIDFGLNSFVDLEQKGGEYRGKLFEIHCRIVRSWSESAGENPLRLDYLTYAFGGNINWDDRPVELIAPGQPELATAYESGQTWKILAWFLQGHAYETKSSLHRAPVFVVASAEPIDTSSPEWIFQLMLIFLGAAFVLVIFFVLMIRKDRTESMRATASLDAMRKRLRDRPSQDS